MDTGTESIKYKLMKVSDSFTIIFFQLINKSKMMI